jgi:hypothetical protein
MKPAQCSCSHACFVSSEATTKGDMFSSGQNQSSRHTPGSDGAFSLSADWKIRKLRENLDWNWRFVKSRKCTRYVSQGQ